MLGLTSVEIGLIFIIVIVVLEILRTVRSSRSTPENLYKDQKSEQFTGIPFRPLIEGPYGLGNAKTYSPLPLLVNFSPPVMSADFKLNGLIRRLKMESNTPTLTNGNKRALVGEKGAIGIGPAKNPILFVPDIGGGKVYTRWSKPDGSTKSAKKLDAYGTFQETSKWSCKDTETEWKTLWFPEDTVGLTRYCWQDLAKIRFNEETQDISNTEGVATKAEKMGSMNFETDIYNVLIEMLYAMSYVEGSTLFGASYDHRLILSRKEFLEWSSGLKSTIEASVKSNGRTAILMGHGFGAVLLNLFLGRQSIEWKNEFIACFITLNGSFGSVPKAVRVMLSGDTLPDKSDQDLIRNGLFGSSGLSLLCSENYNSGRNSKELIVYNDEIYHNSGKDILKIIEKAAGTLFSPSAPKIYEIMEPVKRASVQNPGVTVHIFNGSGIDTETSYVYNDLLSDPVSVLYTNGDGTVPEESLDIPIKWADMQSQSVTYKKYNKAGHSMMLKLYDPMLDLSNIINMYNKN
jgi:hypothetical protein